MTNIITGKSFFAIIENGIRNINLNKKRLNDLNVFPVPDGDTGTNMFMTLKYAFENAKKQGESLSDCANEFASLAVFGARGNSGVILSQFFKGVADGLVDFEHVDALGFCGALEKGCEYAYKSVAKPVEGTMLTVVREATERVKQKLPVSSIDELIETFIEQAKITLANTPELLPVLKKAGVVDSGGAGIVCFFEGVLKYLLGQPIEEGKEDNAEQVDAVNFSSINKDTPMDYGYCVEGLVQLKIDSADFCIEQFKAKLTSLGESVVASIEKDKIKMHVHTKRLGAVMDLCQKFGEFLTIKIENMTVQNLNKEDVQEVERILVAEEFGENFNVVAVASNLYMQKKFLEMGADVVITSDITPSSQDFVDAFSLLDKDILVFPNSSNAILTAVQAGGLCPGKRIKVINSRSTAECYSALSVIDLDSKSEDAVDSINQVINSMYKVCVYRAPKEINYNGVKIVKDDYFSLVGNERIICVDKSIENVVKQTVEKTVEEKDVALVTLFYSSDIDEDFAEKLSDEISNLDLYVDVATVSTMENAYGIILVFE